MYSCDSEKFTVHSMKFTVWSSLNEVVITDSAYPWVGGRDRIRSTRLLHCRMFRWSLRRSVDKHWQNTWRKMEWLCSNNLRLNSNIKTNSYATSTRVEQLSTSSTEYDISRTSDNSAQMRGHIPNYPRDCWASRWAYGEIFPFTLQWCELFFHYFTVITAPAHRTINAL